MHRVVHYTSALCQNWPEYAVIHSQWSKKKHRKKASNSSVQSCLHQFPRNSWETSASHRLSSSSFHLPLGGDCDVGSFDRTSKVPCRFSYKRFQEYLFIFLVFVWKCCIAPYSRPSVPVTVTLNSAVQSPRNLDNWYNPDQRQAKMPLPFFISTKFKS